MPKSKSTRARSTRTEKALFPDLQEYVILNLEYEPLLPRLPGDHGALISSYMHYASDTGPERLPLFIKNMFSGYYRYYGTYSEYSYSDYISRNEMLNVPHHIKEYRARQLAGDPDLGKEP